MLALEFCRLRGKVGLEGRTGGAKYKNVLPPNLILKSKNMTNKKEQFNIKVNRGNGFIYVGQEYLNPYDSKKKKAEERTRIREKYKIQSGEWLNISNFNSVYV